MGIEYKSGYCSSDGVLHASRDEAMEAELTAIIAYFFPHSAVESKTVAKAILAEFMLSPKYSDRV